jgi:hypothetical protein
MPRTCTVCNHKTRQAIEEQLLSGEPYRSIAKRYSVSAAAVFRHKCEHLLLSIQKSHEAREINRGDALVDHVKRLRARTENLYAQAEEILDQAKRTSDLKIALDAIRTLGNVIRESRGNLSLLAQLTGELQPGTGPQIFIVLPAPPATDNPNERSADEHVVNLALPARRTL